MNIGFIGASGLMGHGIAKNLHAKGHALALTVHRKRERVADLLAAGAIEVESPAMLARHSDVAFICVTGSPQVEASMLGESGGLKFELDNARKDLRYYTHLAESLNVPSLVGESVHQSLALASALGHGGKYVPSLVEAQEQLTGATIVRR